MKRFYTIIIFIMVATFNCIASPTSNEKYNQLLSTREKIIIIDKYKMELKGDSAYNVEIRIISIEENKEGFLVIYYNHIKEPFVLLLSEDQIQKNIEALKILKIQEDMDIKNGRKMRECKLILNNGDIIGYKILQTNQIFYHINEKYLYIWTNKTLTDLFQLALDTIHSKKNIKM